MCSLPCWSPGRETFFIYYSTIVMALSKDQKQAQVKSLTEKMQKSQSVIFANYIGLTVADVSDFRGQLLEKEAEMKVAKKTLTALALKEAGLPAVEESALEGPVSLIFSYSDPMSGAQVTSKYGKSHKQVQIIGGIFDGKVLTKEQAIELAEMPSREVLLATFMGMVQSPLRSFAYACNSPLSGFARILQQGAKEGKLGQNS